MATEHLAIATIALALFSEMKMPLKGWRALAAGMVLCTGVGQVLLWILGQ